MRIRIVTIACAITFVMGSVYFMPHSHAQSTTPAKAPVREGLPTIPLSLSSTQETSGNEAQQDTNNKDTVNAAALKTEGMKPEVAALIKQSTAIYAAMKSYKHISEYLIKGQSSEGEVNRTQTYTLALERPNKFCYKTDKADGSVAVSDGKTFINHRNDENNDNGAGEAKRTYYTKTPAPASYKGINIVDDVTFTYGTYMIALMLQGDVLADGEVREALTHASLKAGITENGKKYDLLIVPFMGRPVNFYFDAASHLLHKTVDNQQAGSASRAQGIKFTEIIENVVIDKPLPASTFEYTPPKTSRLIVSLPALTKSETALARLRVPDEGAARTPISLGRSF